MRSSHALTVDASTYFDARTASNLARHLKGEIMQTTENKAVAKMNDYVREGAVKATRGLEALMSEWTHREDLRVKASAMDVEVTASGVRPVIGGRSYNLTDFSRRQLLDRAQMPVTFADNLMTRGLHDLMQRNLRTLIPAVSADGILVRTVPMPDPSNPKKTIPTAKGILSASYRIIDASPLFETFAQESTRLGLVPMDGLVTETRAFLTYIQPEVVEIAPGEHVLFGLDLRNSDYGRGRLAASLMIMRALCANGMIGTDLFSKVHLGKRFGDFDGNDVITVSARTVKLDTATIRSGLRDAMQTFPAQITDMRRLLSSSAAAEVDLPAALGALKKKGLSKTTTEKIGTLYEQELPVEAVPQQPGVWRLANVISMIANSAKGDEQKDLQAVAFDVLGKAAA